MLKIDQTADDQAVSISLREKTKLLTPAFKSAFILAFCLHLGAFGLFHVQPFRINQSHTLFPPVQVNIEIALPNSAIFADLDELNAHDTRVEEPSWAALSIPNVFLKPHYPQSISIAEHTVPPTPFLASLLDGAISTWINLNPKEGVQDHANTFHIFGPLSEIPLLSDNLQSVNQDMNETHAEVPRWQDEILKSFSTNGTRLQTKISRLLYDVKVNNHTGKVFWHHHTSNSSPKSRQLAESILLKLQFKPDDSAFVTPGQIEFFIREDLQ